MTLRHMLLSSTDPCAPSSTALEHCFRTASGVSEDSAKGLASLLQVSLGQRNVQPASLQQCAKTAHADALLMVQGLQGGHHLTLLQTDDLQIWLT